MSRGVEGGRRPETALHIPDIEKVIVFSNDGSGHSLNISNAVMTILKGSRTEVRKSEPALPDNPPPTKPLELAEVQVGCSDACSHNKNER
jgi:hypothetical protein